MESSGDRPTTSGSVDLATDAELAPHPFNQRFNDGFSPRRKLERLLRKVYSSTSPVRMTRRDLLDAFEYQRLSSANRGVIEEALADRGVKIRRGWHNVGIDELVALERDARVFSPEAVAELLGGELDMLVAGRMQVRLCALLYLHGLDRNSAAARQTVALTLRSGGFATQPEVADLERGDWVYLSRVEPSQRTGAQGPREAPGPAMAVTYARSEAEASADEVLRTSRHTSWRSPEQRELTVRFIEGRNTFGILPTGSGKSFCFQQTSRLFAGEGLTLVVSPLIALMSDQVKDNPAGVTFLNSTVSEEDRHSRLGHLKDGRYHLLYCTPEQLGSGTLLRVLQQSRLPVVRIAIDEAHCVSEWGHSFRVEYLLLGDALRRLGSPPVLMLTATAPPAVREDVVKQLGLDMDLARDVVMDFYTRGGPGPQFVLCSATIGNPGALGRQLIGDGKPVREVTRDGSGRGRRLFVSWTPPAKKRQEGRVTVVPDMVETLLTWPKGPTQTIVFQRSRPEVNRMARYCKGRLLDARRLSLAEGLQAFMSHYRKDERAKILAALRIGECPAVFSTSALELGVDIGDLSAAVIVGIPHSRAGFRQMSGRVGRQAVDGRESLVVFVPRDNALDDWFADRGHFSSELVLAEPEDVITDPENEVIAARHIAAAARELGLDVNQDERFFGRRVREHANELEERGVISKDSSPGTYTWIARNEDPHRAINVLAAKGTSQVKVKRKDNGEEIAEVDNWTALWMLFPGAIFEDGIRDTYVVESLHLGAITALRATNHEAVAWVRPARGEEAAHYTVALTETQVHILDTDGIQSSSVGELEVSHGRVRVTSSLQDQYWRVRRAQGGRTITAEDRVRLQLPARPQAIGPDGQVTEYPTIAYDSHGLWFEVPDETVDLLGTEARNQGDALGAEQVEEYVAACLHGAEHLLCKITAVLPGFCEDDIGGISTLAHPDLAGPAIVLYEGVPGGSGLIGRLAVDDNLAKVLEAALEAVKSCPCESGCPHCVLDRLCGSKNLTISKQGSMGLLAALVAQPCRGGPGPRRTSS